MKVEGALDDRASGLIVSELYRVLGGTAAAYRVEVRVLHFFLNTCLWL